MRYSNAVDTKFLQDRSGNSVKPSAGRVSGVDSRKVDRVDPVFGGIEKSAEAHHLVFYSSDGFMGDVIAQNGNRVAHVFADVLSRYIPGRIVIDKRKGIVHRETEELDVVKAAVKRVIWQQREGQRDGRLVKE